jgi:TRAP-type C4-dicarboxylate transport system substrate-binding protein
MSLSYHRYEGWVVVAPLDRWLQSAAATREALEAALSAVRDWQRRDTEQREVAALAELKGRGMTLYDVDAAERAAFAAALPDRTELMSNRLGPAQRRALVDLASAGTAAFVTTAGPPGAQPGGSAPPGSQQHQAD